MQTLQMIALGGCLVMMHVAGFAADSEYPRVAVSAGTEYTTGTYGGDEDIEDI